MSSLDLETIQKYAPLVRLFPHPHDSAHDVGADLRVGPYVVGADRRIGPYANVVADRRIGPNVPHNLVGPYNPCSVDDYLARVQLVTPGCPPQSPVTAAHLANAGSDTHLQIADDPGACSPVRAGNFNPSAGIDAPVYVHLRRVPHRANQFDIQYWFFYAVRGRSTGYLRAGFDYYFDLLGPTADQPRHPKRRPHGRYQGDRYDRPYTHGYQGPGEHQGDWKHVTVRVDAWSEMLGVYYAQHDSGFWVDRDDVPLHAGTRPIVYSARNTHSCYPAAGKFFQQRSLTFRLPGLGLAGMGLLEWMADGGQLWDCARPGGLQIVADDIDNSSSRPAWLDYPGYWGPVVKQRLDPATFARPNLAMSLPSGVRNLLARRGQRVLDTLVTGARSPAMQSAWHA